MISLYVATGCILSCYSQIAMMLRGDFDLSEKDELKSLVETAMKVYIHIRQL